MTLSDSDDVQTISSGSEDNKDRGKAAPGKGQEEEVPGDDLRVLMIYSLFLSWSLWPHCDQKAGGGEIHPRHRPEEQPQYDGEDGNAWRGGGNEQPGGQTWTPGAAWRRGRKRSQEHPPVLRRRRILLHHRCQAGGKSWAIPQRNLLNPFHVTWKTFIFASQALISLCYSTAAVPTCLSRTCSWTRMTCDSPGWRSLPASGFTL